MLYCNTQTSSGIEMNVVQLWQLQCADQGHERMTALHRLAHPVSQSQLEWSGEAYFGDVCAPVTDTPGRTNLRSATHGDFLIPWTWTKLSERSFCISALTVWNSLPYSLKHSATSRKHSRKELKTYMFRKAYAPASENNWRLNLLTYLKGGKLQVFGRLSWFWVVCHNSRTQHCSVQVTCG